jgi:hypothetical protein
MEGDSIYSMTDKERLDHALVVFTLLNEELLAEICKAVKKYDFKFRIENDFIYIEYFRPIIEIVQQSKDRLKRNKVFYVSNLENSNDNEITFKLTHNPE